MPQVGVIHLALQNDSTGSVLSWQNDVFVVAEPGELADRFLQSVKTSLSTLLRGRSHWIPYKNMLSQVGAWRERIIVCSGRYGLTHGLIKAFVDAGAKAVISSSIEPPDAQAISYHGMDLNGNLENGKFVIGEDETDELEPEPASPISDWEDSDAEKSGNNDVDDEEYLAQFICLLYDKLFREGVTVDTALQQALRLHPKLKFSCHLPNVL
ncbi:hypothetical protein PR202_ga29792 [Eleusine coracana subsp. coracana]|uniref:Uncharacterized protein n=1 Tax=Eleusine coracana subsp. coracana TaxID=191504 RepID=A0AAV5DMZ4_ELECO|nr:hypothetical protein PR202_ga29792 [Eleusine coracana subsp. coracana]